MPTKPTPSEGSLVDTEPRSPQKSEANEQDQHDEKAFDLRSPKFWIVMVGIYISFFLVALDRLIITTAIPNITNEFNSIEDIGWYGSAYMLTCSIFNPLFGRIYQLFPTKSVFLLSIVVFEAGSALSGAAPNSTAFILGRAISGIGAAGIFCGGIMITIPLVPLHKRPVFTSIFGMAFGVSSVLGPLIGGSFTGNSHLTWRWCFYINLPIGAFTILVVLFFLHLEPAKREETSPLQKLTRLDPLGLLFFVPSMVCLILALQWGGSSYSWSAPRIIGLLVTFAVTFILFLITEVLLPETAMAPTRVVLNRSVAGSMAFMLFLSGAMMTLIYYLTIWFQAIQNQSAMEAGIRTIPSVMALVIFSFVGGGITQKIGYYVPAMLLSSILCSVGTGLLSTLTPLSGANCWIGYQIVFGIGVGFGISSSNLGPQTVLPQKDVPLGMAMMFFMQQIGGAVFISVAQNIFSGQLITSLSGLGGLDPSAITNTGATDLRNIVPSDELGTVTDLYSFALTRTFILAATLSAVMIVGASAVEWRSIKKGKQKSENGSDNVEKLSS